MSPPSHLEQTFRKLKSAAYVERVLASAEACLGDQRWWNSDIEELIAAVRGASINHIAAIADTWAGLRWLDAAENLLAADWLAESYPGYASACLQEMSELLLNYGREVPRSRLAVRIPRSRLLLTHGNRRMVHFPREHAGTCVYWAAGDGSDDIAWSDANGREIVTDSQLALCVDGSGESDAGVPVFDDTSGRRQSMNRASRDNVAAYLARLPDSALQIIRDGRGLIVLSDVELRDGDTRPSLLVRPQDMNNGEYRDVARQLVAWLGGAFMRLDWSSHVPREVARLVVQYACGRLESSGGQAGWLWHEQSSVVHRSGLNPLRLTVHAAIESTMEELADVVRPLPLSARTVELLAPINEQAAMKTRNNGLVPANWYVVDHVSALDVQRRQLVVGELSSGERSEGELFVLAACRYADGMFREALEHARACLRIDPDCMEYQYLAAFCCRHLGQDAVFAVAIFGERDGA